MQHAPSEFSQPVVDTGIRLVRFLFRQQSELGQIVDFGQRDKSTWFIVHMTPPIVRVRTIIPSARQKPMMKASVIYGLINECFSQSYNGLVQNDTEPLKQFFFISGNVGFYQSDDFNIANVTADVICQRPTHSLTNLLS
jgi:hypothetical protein